MTDVTSRILITAASQGLDQVVSEINRLKLSQEGLARASESAEKVTASYQNRLRSIQMSLDANFRATEKLKDVERDLNRAREAGLVSLDRQNQLMEMARQRYQSTTAASNQAATATGNSAAAVQQLGFQINDLATQIASGGSPFQALAQQGGQIMQVYQQSPTVFGDTARAISAVITPMRALGGAVVITAGGLAMIGMRFSEAQFEVERQVNGLGRASGMTVQSINALARAEADRARISVAAAREIAAGYAATGRIDGGNIGALTSITRDFSAQTGAASIKEASDTLAKAFSGSVVQGAERLNEQLGFLDNRTREYLRTLEEQGRRQEAQRVLIDAMQTSVEGAADRVNWLSRAWDGVKNVLSNVADRIGQAVAGETTLQDKLAEAIKRRIELESGLGSRSASGQQRLARIGQEIGLIQEQIRQQSRLRQQETENAQNRRLSNEVGSIVRDVERDVERVRELRSELEKIDRLLSSSSALGVFGDNAAGLQRAREALNNAINTSLTNEQKLRQEGDLQVRSALARTAAERLSVDLDRERLNMSGLKLTNLERELALQNRINEAQAAANREAQDALRSANDNASMAGMRPYERAMREIELRMRDLRERTTVPDALGSVGGSATSALTSAATSMNAAAAAITRIESGGRYDAIGPETRTGDRAYGRYQVMGANIPSWTRQYYGQQLTPEAFLANRQAQDAVFQGEFGRLSARHGPEGAARAWFAGEAGMNNPNARDVLGTTVSDYSRKFLAAGGAANENALGIQAQTQAMVAGVAASEKYTAQQRLVEIPLRDATDELGRQQRAFGLQEQAASMSARALATAQKEQEILNRFMADGTPITAGLRTRVRELAEGYGELAHRQQSSRLMRDLTFEREQMFRDPGERQVASRLRGTFGDSYMQHMQGAEAAQMRFNMQLEQSIGLASEFGQTFLSDMRQGKSATEALVNAASRLGDRLLSMALDQSIRSLFASMNGGLAGGGFSLLNPLSWFGGGASASTSIGPSFMPGTLFAQGGAFNAGNVVPFANGGAFSNSIVNRPTLFPMANGAGLMGEAGPEAIMPLKRDASGRLGVQAQAGAAANTTIHMGDVTIKIDGSADQKTVAMIEQKLAEHRQAMRRDVVPIVREAARRGVKVA